MPYAHRVGFGGAPPHLAPFGGFWGVKRSKKRRYIGDLPENVLIEWQTDYDFGYLSEMSIDEGGNSKISSPDFEKIGGKFGSNFRLS